MLLENGGDPHQANDKGDTPIVVCRNPAVMKLLKEKSYIEEEGEDKREVGSEAKGRAGVQGDGLGGEGEEDEGDEYVFETKMETGEPERRERKVRSEREGNLERERERETCTCLNSHR